MILSGSSTVAVGIFAGTLTTISFVPQVVKIWRTRSSEDVSTAMFSIFSLGTLLWLVYGFMIDSLPVIIANGITLILSLGVLGLKYKWSRNGIQVKIVSSKGS